MRKKYHCDNLKEDIKKRLLKEVRTHAHINMSFRQLARDLEVSHNAIYHHFKNQDEIFQYAIESCFEIFEFELSKSLDQISENSQNSVEATGLAYFNFCKTEPNLYLFMFNHLKKLPKEKSESFSDRAFSILLTITNNDKDKAYFLWSAIHGLCNLLLNESFKSMKLDDENITDKVKKFVSTCSFAIE